MNIRTLLVALAVSYLTACAASRERATGAATAADMTSVPLSLGETTIGGEPLYRVKPTYPSAQLAACPASEEIDAVVYVDANGTVSDVIGAVIDMAQPPWDTFFAAVRTAVLQWRFEPLRVDHWAADAQGNSHAVDGRTHRFARQYVFSFTCRSGATQVTVRALTGAYVR